MGWALYYLPMGAYNDSKSRGQTIRNFLIVTGAAYSVLTEPLGLLNCRKTSVQGIAGQTSYFS